MYIHLVSRYIPEQVVPNEYFFQLTGLTDEWITSRTGMKQRRRAAAGENTNTMAVAASQRLVQQLAFPKEEIDLIVGATYTPYDTIVSLAHQVQHELDIPDIPVVAVSAACSSLLNALEVVEGYFALGKASKALVVVADHNTAYADETDPKSGHLWGDGAAALLLSSQRLASGDLQVLDLHTAGAATVGKAMEGVVLRPRNGGIHMGDGRDVFLHACTYMAQATTDILAKNGYQLSELSYYISHQANYRITRNVAQTLGLPEEKVISNLQYLGNTGCAGCAIGLSEHWQRFGQGELIALAVFGGGYSYGAMLLRR